MYMYCTNSTCIYIFYGLKTDKTAMTNLECIINRMIIPYNTLFYYM